MILSNDIITANIVNIYKHQRTNCGKTNSYVVQVWDDFNLRGAMDFHYKWMAINCKRKYFIYNFIRLHPVWMKYYYLTKTDPNLTA